MSRPPLLFAAVLLAALGSAAPTRAEATPVLIPGDGSWLPTALEIREEEGALTVGYTVGEAPDVWPNARRDFAEPLDISRWSRLEFDLRVVTPPGALPPRTLSVLLRNPWGASWQQDSLPFPSVPGEWVRQRIDLNPLPTALLARVGQMQFFVWNRDYQDAGFPAGSRITFEIRNLAVTGKRPELPARVFPEAEPPARLLALRDGIAVWAEPADTKILPEAEPPAGTGDLPGVIRLRAAANESADVQIAVRAERGIASVAVAVVPPPEFARALDPVSVRPEGFVRTETPSAYHIRPGLCPDPLLPPGPLDAAPGETRAFWVRVSVPPGTPKGTFRGTVAVTFPGADPVTVPLEIEVYGFELPATTRLPTAFQLSFDKDWSRFLDYYPDADDALFERFWRSLARHRMSPMHTGRSGPPRPADEASLRAFDRTLDLADELRFNRFLSFYWGPPVETEEDREWVRTVVDHYIARGLYDRTYCYMAQYDEARPERWPATAAYAKALHEADPRIPRMLTVAPAPELYGAIDIWCPGTPHYDRAAADERRALGEKVWWYTCVQWTPGLLIDHPGTMHRALFWLSFTERVDGFLFWCVNYWQKNPWESPRQGPGTAGNGDGYFYYPPRPGDPADAIHESLRLEMIRAGIEDYEVMAMLRDLLADAEAAGAGESAAARQGRAALADVAKVVVDVRTYSSAAEDYAIVRHRVSLAVEALVRERGPAAPAP